MLFFTAIKNLFSPPPISNWTDEIKTAVSNKNQRLKTIDVSLKTLTALTLLGEGIRAGYSLYTSRSIGRHAVQTIITGTVLYVLIQQVFAYLIRVNSLEGRGFKLPNADSAAPKAPSIEADKPPASPDAASPLRPYSVPLEATTAIVPDGFLKDKSADTPSLEDVTGAVLEEHFKASSPVEHSPMKGTATLTAPSTPSASKFESLFAQDPHGTVAPSSPSPSEPDSVPATPTTAMDALAKAVKGEDSKAPLRRSQSSGVLNSSNLGAGFTFGTRPFADDSSGVVTPSKPIDATSLQPLKLETKIPAQQLFGIAPSDVGMTFDLTQIRKLNLDGTDSPAAASPSPSDTSDAISSSMNSTPASTPGATPVKSTD